LIAVEGQAQFGRWNALTCVEELNMATLVEFTPTPSRFWTGIAALEESDRKRSDMFMKRYEALLRLSRCLTSAQPEELVTSISAELRPVVDFDLLDIVVSRAGSSEIRPTSGKADEAVCDGESRHSSDDAYEEDTAPAHSSRVSCLPRGEEIKTQCSLPLISRGSELGFLVVGRFAEDDFSQDDVEFLTQAAGQVAIFIDNSMAHRHIAQLTEKLTPESIYFDDELPTETNFEEIVGRSAALRSLLRQVETVAPTDSTVLIYGETGTGKELIARALHNLSARHACPFVKLNCAAIPTGLLESELFGHERGAFTSAIAQRIGRFELANRGTIFLDEIGEIPLELQPKLLRVLQEQEFEPLGSTRTKKVDVRLVAATHRNLETMMASDQFRSDLYYRLNVFPVRIPPLRERPKDIPLLVRYFTDKYARRMGKQIETIPAGALRKLMGWHWPGNVRELENLVERAVILTSSDELAISVSEQTSHATVAPARIGNWDEQERTLRILSDLVEQAAVPTSGNTLPVAVPGLTDTGTAGVPAEVRNLDEQDTIVRVLEETKGRVGGANGAAARLGLKRTTLIARMKKLGIDGRHVLDAHRYEARAGIVRLGRGPDNGRLF
jgi:formate hydrogenlyase transcriptional activator